MVTCSRLPSEDGSVISNESEKLNSGRGSAAQKVTAQQKLTKEETRKKNDPYDTSFGSLQLISIKPMTAPPTYSHPASSDRSQDSAILNGNGEVNLALKQKSDIEHYRNKLRLKAKRKGYYDFPSADGSGRGSRALAERQRHGHERAPGEHGPPLEPDEDRASTYVKSSRRHSQVRQRTYRSRQSLNSPSTGGTEMDLLVMRERPRRGIRNSGYDTEPELIEETNVDRLIGPRGGYVCPRGVKGHSETSTLSSQPSIDEVRQQMHLLLEEAFSLASGGHSSTAGRHHHSHHPHHGYHHGHYSPGPPPLPYSDVVTSAPLSMSRSWGGCSDSSMNMKTCISAASPNLSALPSPPSPEQHSPQSPLQSSTPLSPLVSPEQHSPQSPSPEALPFKAEQPMSTYSGGSPGVRGGLPSSPLPSRQLPQTPPTLWPGHGATPHPDHRRVPAEPARCGGAQRQSPLSSLSTSALVQAIRQEVAKLAKKQTDMFEFQV
ncbi:UPF0606 protein KIAA1549L-like [Oncorhynchus keta]|uniref:UPF0606 protein KIAA1549L-like n=1 Tax=Oncorhynchus keta TaxID=8018 RepID=UPI00227B35F2|nr:UPF0606 protein KIAA1549L-like [Oncorhynchus keta]